MLVSDTYSKGYRIENAFDAPWTGPGSDLTLSEGPWIDPTAFVKDSTLGAWTLVGPGAIIVLRRR